MCQGFKKYMIMCSPTFYLNTFRQVFKMESFKIIDLIKLCLLILVTFCLGYKQGWIFLKIPCFFNGENFPSSWWSGKEFPICSRIILINSRINSPKVVRINLVSYANLTWNNNLSSQFYISKYSENNNKDRPRKMSQITLKNGEELAFIS